MYSTAPEDLPRFAELEAEYELLGELGRGGTAVVYLARERELDRKIAIKVIRATYVEDEEAAARLAREAHTIAGLQHPNIVMLYGTRRLRDQSLALIMQYVEGHTLKAEIQHRGALPFERVEQVLRDMGSALAYAHRHRIVHRDIKPENIYIDEETGIARLSDFGIARPWDADSGLTLPGSAIGTPAYMSPEQIDGHALDGRSDLFSLGLVGYEMLTGERPWAGETLFSIVVKQKHEELPRLDTVRPGIPRALQQAVEGSIRKKAEQRWQDADAFLRVLCGRPSRETASQPAAVVSARPQPKPRLETSPDPDGLTVQFRPRDMQAAAPSAPVPAAPVTATPPAATVPTSAERRPPRRAAVPKPQVMAAVPPRRRWRLAAAAGAAVVLLGAFATIAVSGGRATPDPAPTDTVTPAPVDPGADAAGASPGAAPVTPSLAYVLYGDLQSAVLGDTMPQPLIVRVEDASGSTVVGARVRFAVVEGDAVLVPDTARTDAAGTAGTRVVARRVGMHTIEAGIEGLAQPIQFRVRARPRPPAKLLAATTADVRGTTGASSSIAVRVEDDLGNPVANVQVQFGIRAGDGALTPATVATGPDGTARAQWTLGAPGPQQVLVTTADLPDASVTFNGVATAAPVAVRRTVTAGGTHTCSLASDGGAVCWGGNDHGQLGDGTASRRSSPVRVAAPEPLATVAAGVTHSCGIGVSGTGFCWGGNSAGQLGDGTRTSRGQPARIALQQRLTSIAVGMAHSCAIDTAGRLYCWGQNTHGQLGDGSQTDRPGPVRVAGNRTYRSVTVGWAHTCAVSAEGAAFCWGRNGSGELGNGDTADRPEPARVTGGYRFTTVAAGSSHTCGLLTTGAMLCWGQNTNGQLGNGSTTNSPMPQEVVGQETFSALAVGGVHTCGLTREGAALCWGRNTYGQLGDASTQDRARPAPVEGGLRFTALHASGSHTCGTAPGGALYCWGFNLEGQIGDGTRSNQLRPVPVGREG